MTQLIDTTNATSQDSFPTIPVFNHGYVTLEDVMGDSLSILNNAKVSFDSRATELDKSGKGVLNFLMRERHGSPWEAVVFRFNVRAPIFVNREWFRHRVGSFNEESMRYSRAKPEFYLPEKAAIRSQVGKPGNYSFEPITDPMLLGDVEFLMETTCQNAINVYENLVEKGVARELARSVLPVAMYSSFIWTVNLRALFNFLQLRNHEHAQFEIREYADAVEELAKQACPYAFELFEQHGRVCP